MNFIPHNDKILLKAVPQQEKTEFGLYLPQSTRSKPEEGIVVGVGLGRLHETGERIPMPFQIGDKVIFQAWVAVPFEHNRKEYFLISEKDVLLVIRDGEGSVDLD